MWRVFWVTETFPHVTKNRVFLSTVAKDLFVANIKASNVISVRLMDNAA